MYFFPRYNILILITSFDNYISIPDNKKREGSRNLALHESLFVTFLGAAFTEVAPLLFHVK